MSAADATLLLRLPAFWWGLGLGALAMLAGLSLACLLRARGWARRSLALDASRYPAVIQSAPDAVISINEQQRIVLFNPAAERLLGCSAEQALGSSLERFIPAEMRALHTQWVQSFCHAAETDKAMARGREVQALRADGSRVAVEAAIARLLDPRWPGSAQLYTVVLRDVSKRKADEAQLYRIQERYRRMVEQSPEAIWLSEGQRIDMVNRACLQLLGAADEHELVGSDPRRFLPDDWAPLQAGILQAGSAGLVRACHITRLDGQVRAVEVSAAEVPDHDQLALQLVMRDVTDRRAAELALHEQHDELRRLSAQLTHIREEERRHLARELHDELGQQLTAIHIELAALVRDSPAALRPRLQELMGRIDQGVASVRRIAANLRPAMLDDLGLEATLDWLAKDWAQRTGLSIQVQIEALDGDLTDTAKITLYRIVQEALTNVSRHAQAQRVHITLQRQGSQLALCVQDDGVGAAAHPPQRLDSLGLRGIRERARVLGGQVTLSNAEQGGFRLEVHIPFERVDSGVGELQE